MSGLRHSGNQAQKGSCCGGYNSLNEDYAWALVQRGWPTWGKNSCDPFALVSVESYQGYDDNNKMQNLLWGKLRFENGTLEIGIINDEGQDVRILPQNGYYEGFITAIYLADPDGSKGYSFDGWIFNLTGEAIGAGLEIEFDELVGSSYPAPIAMRAARNLTPKTPVSTFGQSSVTLLSGSNSCSVSIEITRIATATGFEEYTAGGLNKLISGVNCDAVVTSVENNIDGTAVMFVQISNVQADAVVTWAFHIPIKIQSFNAAFAQSITFVDFATDDLSQTISVAITAVNAGESAEGYVNGLVAAKDTRSVDIYGTGDNFPGSTLLYWTVNTGTQNFGTLEGVDDSDTEVITMPNSQANCINQPAVLFTLGEPD